MCLPATASRESNSGGGGGGGGGKGGEDGGKEGMSMSLPDTEEEIFAKRIAKELKTKLNGSQAEVTHVGRVTTDGDGTAVKWCRVELPRAVDVGGGIKMGSVELRVDQLLFMDDVEDGKVDFIACSSCAFELPRDCFSQAQLKKRKQKHTARCLHCIDTNRTSMPAEEAADDAPEPARLTRNQRKARERREIMQPPQPPPPPPPSSPPPAEPEPPTGRQAEEQTDDTLAEEEEEFYEVHTAPVGWV
jgi:hypothetical protein